MTRSLSSMKVELKLFASLQNLLTDSNVVSVNHPNLNYKPTLSSGVDASQANRGWQSKTRTLQNGVSEDIDLYDLGAIDIGAGLGNDGVGQAVEPNEEIVAVAIVNDNAVTADGMLEIEPSSTNGWTSIGTHTNTTKGALRGQGVLFKCQIANTGFEVTDGSSHRIKLTAYGGSVSYSIYLMARSDVDQSSSSTSSSQSTSSSSQSVSTSSSSPSSSSWSSSSSISTSSSSESSSSSSSSSSISTSSESSSQSSSSRSSQSSISTSSVSSQSSSSQS